jgi:lipoate-protein ligase A
VNEDRTTRMQRLDLALDDPCENLAVDEALLELLEAGHGEELLRFWEFRQFVVVLGRSSNYFNEIDVSACQRDAITILRRRSGGASIVAGPGCLLYSLLIDLELRPHLRDLTTFHAWVMEGLVRALRTLNLPALSQGTCDVTVDDCKVSGNSLRVGRRGALYHGTVMYQFPLTLISQYLRTAPRQPLYRQNRPHSTFVANVPADPEGIKNAMAAHWQVDSISEIKPLERAKVLAENRYRNPEWTFGKETRGGTDD